MNKYTVELIIIRSCKNQVGFEKEFDEGQIQNAVNYQPSHRFCIDFDKILHTIHIATLHAKIVSSVIEKNPGLLLY